ncbi:maleylacetoacetate isomerase [Sandarakinorhabdus cyanobacteriorum]|uniref:Maleylacetoacetate isomerase n=1 Tax=Sandarakinorhabdus cyanobacteriorum TaxID=1981098 RepID=A0A255YRV3_9SPHN|nr:maleylacetoacetate isomerase [Sandarakinorhabdus cyanobacteriorum]OYQ31911.1 maleylacetoacetate isomerase [Sandarakinorhabdus cyanobacteriorum]
MGALVLHDYWRSSAAWRVRLALAAKGQEATRLPVSLLAGDQRSPAHLARNPQGLVPVLEDGPLLLSQSLAIIEYIEESFPEPPLLPADAAGRALVRSAALVIAADVHPLGNLRVQRWLRDRMGQDDDAVTLWLHHWMADGLSALEEFAARHGGQFLFGDRISIADLCLVPQLYNARRFGLQLDDYPRLLAVDMAVAALPWSAAARPQEPLNPT